MNVSIVIPTKGRPNLQPTWDLLPPELKELTWFCVTEQEKDAFLRRTSKVHVVPNNFRVGQSRQNIIQSFAIKPCKNVVMMDDDLKFYARDPEGFTELHQQSDDEKVEMIQWMVDQLENGYAHCAISPREGNNHYEDEEVYNSRCMRVLGYRTDVLMDEGIKFTDMELMEDFHVCLSLLERGYENVVSTFYAHNQNGSNTAGGCSEYRTLELNAQQARRLAELHAPFVKVTQKKTKSAWGGQERTDVVVYWKKALRSRMNERVRPS